MPHCEKAPLRVIRMRAREKKILVIVGSVCELGGRLCECVGLVLDYRLSEEMSVFVDDLSNQTSVPKEEF